MAPTRQDRDAGSSILRGSSAWLKTSRATSGNNPTTTSGLVLAAERVTRLSPEEVARRPGGLALRPRPANATALDALAFVLLAVGPAPGTRRTTSHLASRRARRPVVGVRSARVATIGPVPRAPAAGPTPCVYRLAAAVPAVAALIDGPPSPRSARATTLPRDTKLRATRKARTRSRGSASSKATLVEVVVGRLGVPVAIGLGLTRQVAWRLAVPLGCPKAPAKPP